MEEYGIFKHLGDMIWGRFDYKEVNAKRWNADEYVGLIFGSDYHIKGGKLTPGSYLFIVGGKLPCKDDSGKQVEPDVVLEQDSRRNINIYLYKYDE